MEVNRLRREVKSNRVVVRQVQVGSGTKKDWGEKVHDGGERAQREAVFRIRIQSRNRKILSPPGSRFGSKIISTDPDLDAVPDPDPSINKH
jgi:hypothetical protein